MKIILSFILMAFAFAGCVPDNMKRQLDDGLVKAQTMMADQGFKSTIGNIELYKLRHGQYPAKITDLEFLPAMDSSFIHSVDYIKLDSGYVLNINATVTSFTGATSNKVLLSYPAEFWKGLGCVKSNTKE